MKIELTIEERNLILDCLKDTVELLKMKNQEESKKYYNSIERLELKINQTID